MNDALEFISLLSIDKLTEKKLYLLFKKFNTPKALGAASKKDIAAVVGQELAQKIDSLQINENIKKQYAMLQKLKINIVPYYSTAYPHWLKYIDHFPPFLFIRGIIKKEDELSIAIVGTRGATVYGKKIAEEFAAAFAQAGITVVSGMARGIDTAAHRGALKGNGRTIAVLGCGVDICYPPENKDLMNEIIKNGAIISEFTIGRPPLAHNFPQRNRIISGFSKAVVAIEAKEKSGVMNTVQWALDIYSKASKGTNRLIKDGAIPVTSAQEIMESLGVRYSRKERETKEALLNEDEKAIWNHLSFEPIYLDILAEKLNQPTASILNTLLSLEIKGLVKQLPGMMFVKNFE
jgi:DNA processing protein